MNRLLSRRSARDVRQRKSVTYRGAYLLVYVLLFTMVGSVAHAEPAIDIEQLQTQWLRAPAVFMSTTQDFEPWELPLEQFMPLEDVDINRGITDDDHWIRVRLSNAANSQPMRWVLHHETAYLDELSIYFSDDDAPLQVRHLSDQVSFRERLLPYRALAFEHETRAGGYTDLYLRLRFVKADAMSLNLRLSQADVFRATAQRSYLGHGIYFGIMGSLLLTTLAIGLTLRQVVFLAYAVFLGISIVLWALVNGFGFQYAWPDAVYLHNEGVHILYLLMAISALWFSRLFLKTPELCPRINVALIGLMVLYSAGIVLRLAGVYVPVLYLSYAALCSLVLLAVLGVCVYLNGVRYARWYALAWMVFGAGLLLSVLSAGSNWFHWGMRPLMFTQIASLLEATFLMMALGERLALWRADHQRALRLVHQDPLTGLGNRRTLLETLNDLQALQEKGGLPVYLIMIDLDHFKSINDTYGHEAGDKVLVGFAELLRRICRPDDVCVRYGGEEFAVLLRAPGITQAREVAERIRREFENQPTLYEETLIQHTLTVGLSKFEPDDPDAVANLFRQADRALYAAKLAGRNQTVVHD